jgi:hypothetical protein
MKPKGDDLMKLKAFFVILLLNICAMAQSTKPVRKMAVTFDDLPYVALGRQDLSEAQRVTRALLRGSENAEGPNHCIR